MNNWFAMKIRGRVNYYMVYILNEVITENEDRMKIFNLSVFDFALFTHYMHQTTSLPDTFS